MLSRDELRAMHITLQADLARFGITRGTTDAQYQLDRELCRVHRIDLFDARLDELLEELHVEAYRDVKPRPPRLLARDGVVELVDIMVD
jgi:hypothetical protein